MHIPLITLAERARLRITHSSDADRSLLIKGVRLHPEQEDSALLTNFLYIRSLGDGQVHLTVKGHARTPVWKEVVEDDRPIEAIFNEILEIMERFSRWDTRLRELLSQHQTLQRAMRILTKMMGNPVYLVDASYKVIAIDDSELYSEISAIWRHLSQYRYLSYDIIAQMRKRRELQKLDAQKTASLFESEVFPTVFINRNLRAGQEITGHLFVVGYCRQITPGDIALAEQLGSCLEKALKDNLGVFSSRGRITKIFSCTSWKKSSRMPIWCQNSWLPSAGPFIRAILWRWRSRIP